MPRRRFLLSADPSARVYLDLTTGAEITEPAPAIPEMPRPRKSVPPPAPVPPPSLADAVAAALDALAIRYHRISTDTFRMSFQGKLMNPEVLLECDDAARVLRVRADLQVSVPPRKEEAMRVALQDLAYHYGSAQVLYHAQRQATEAYHVAFVGDVTPTPDYLVGQIRVITEATDVLHYALAHFVMQGGSPLSVGPATRGMDEQLLTLWQPVVDADDEGGASVRE